MKTKLILIATTMMLAGLIALYRNWGIPLNGDEKKLFLTKKQLRNHALVGGYCSLVTGIIIFFRD